MQKKKSHSPFRLDFVVLFICVAVYLYLVWKNFNTTASESYTPDEVGPSIVHAFPKEDVVDVMDLSGDYNASQQEYLLTTGEWTDGTNKKTHFIPNKSDSDYIDYNRAIKSACTSFITNFCLSSPYWFLHRIISAHEEAFLTFHKEQNVPRPIFIYKGGNVLLFVYKAFMEKFPQMAREELFRHFSPYFAPSDADFSVFYDPDSFSDEQHQQLVTLCVDIQKHLRDTFLNNPTRYFTFYRYTVDYQQELLGTLLHNVRDLPIWSDPENIYYYQQDVLGVGFLHSCRTVRHKRTLCPLLLTSAGQHDMRIRFNTQTSKDDTIRVDFLGPRRDLYVQDNRALRFSRGTGVLHFDLIRTKFDFRFLFSPQRVLHSNGELIDVSINRDTTLMKDSWTSLDHMITTYSINYDDVQESDGTTSTKTLYFKGLTYEYLIKDLERILFTDLEYPWYDEKYEKRLHRLFLLDFMDLFLQSSLWFDMLKHLGDCFSALYHHEWNSPSCELWLSSVTTSSFAFHRLFVTLYNLGQCIQHQPPSSPNHTAFQKLIQLCMDDTVVCLNVYSDLQQYILQGGRILQRDIYTFV